VPHHPPEPRPAAAAFRPGSGGLGRCSCSALIRAARRRSSRARASYAKATSQRVSGRSDKCY
jgi:hypothetical protein